eukprot:CAMPEP_0176337848 /NCGR_PEP_ID=MMETSP0121_2-20121125/79840_1 /TAXON_ID=160619 /ORGANISM="Kryptoperidinium foliaceum, Strain CCMP 1326" /LENGTH=130 /DNA_ID=CAMNT_0017680863 /DNA_START=272 /DNA_END=662 /DNA_ORIENTATION=+
MEGLPGLLRLRQEAETLHDRLTRHPVHHPHERRTLLRRQSLESSVGEMCLPIHIDCKDVLDGVQGDGVEACADVQRERREARVQAERRRSHAAALPLVHEPVLDAKTAAEQKLDSMAAFSLFDAAERVAG